MKVSPLILLNLRVFHILRCIYHCAKGSLHLTALRLYPQLPVNVRFATKTTLLPSGGGPSCTSPVLIRKGTGVAWSVYHMHRMISLYGLDADEFAPERWEDTRLEKEVGWGFMPFHGGPRICLGSEFSLFWHR